MSNTSSGYGEGDSSGSDTMDDTAPGVPGVKDGPVLVLRSAVLSYGDNMVLDSLDMTVRRADIYGLLGASGCGKTSLLSVIVGRRHLRSGTVRVLGGVPGDRRCGVPGPRVGFMPQELALYTEFTIMETFFYFGRINKMTGRDIKTQLTYLTQLLELP